MLIIENLLHKETVCGYKTASSKLVELCKVVIYTEDIPNIDMLYTEDILNAIIQPNYPEQLLVLKVGMPVILMRNLDHEMGLCNRTRLFITRLADCVLKFTNMILSSSDLNKYTGRKDMERGDCK
jgi:hypothetical protein